VRVVIDTNSLLVSIGRRSKYRPIFEALISGQLKLLLTNEILTEYAEILGRRANAEVAENVINFLLRSPDVERIEIYFKWSLIYADADDNKFADCAFNGRADYIVTDDRHFSVLREIEFPEMRVIKTKDFLKLLPKS